MKMQVMLFTNNLASARAVSAVRRSSPHATVLLFSSAPVFLCFSPVACSNQVELHVPFLAL